MSRLEEMVARYTSQRDILNFSLDMIPVGEGLIGIELGLGSGRTYDHLREKLPEMQIFTFDRKCEIHPRIQHPGKYFIEGEITSTFPAFAKKHKDAASFVHIDLGTSQKEQDQKLYQELEPSIREILIQDGLLISDRPFSSSWEAVNLSSLKLEWPYYLYRKGK